MYESKIKDEHTELLVKAILELKTPEECYRLFDDLCTIREIQDLAQRMEVAQMLRKKTTYNEIAQKTGVSTATISRVNRCLTYGAGGYETVLKRLEEKETK
ncbi:MAG TPA: hypothetical protein IAA59_02190 [Candidatus Faecaligallichristensenella faecipullorum]|nr:hypothetical protein [Candidatus Faecaligallichristensenella faecipullorum]